MILIGDKVRVVDQLDVYCGEEGTILRGPFPTKNLQVFYHVHLEGVPVGINPPDFETAAGALR